MHKMKLYSIFPLAVIPVQSYVGFQNGNTDARLCKNIDRMPKRLKKKNAIRTTLIAPCGMNCHLCRDYIRGKKPCPGCRGDDSLKSKACVSCKINNCEKITEGRIKYCFSCGSFPCAALNHLDNRYRTRYAMSIIDNLKGIREFGIRDFIKNEKERWACPECGELICVHKDNCISCGYKWR